MVYIGFKNGNEQVYFESDHDESHFLNCGLFFYDLGCLSQCKITRIFLHNLFEIVLVGLLNN